MAPAIVDLEHLNGILWSAENFGPVVAAADATDYADALRLPDDTEVGLAAAVFARDMTHARTRTSGGSASKG